MSDLRVNFSDEEAGSEARDFDAIPSGKYYARITDITPKECGPESKNAGKPYWNIEFTIQNGPFEDRKVWTNCMLFEGALYTLAQLLKSTGNEAALQTGVVPDPDTFISKEVYVNVKKMRDSYREERDGDGEPQWKNEVKSIAKYEAATASTAGGSLLP